VPDYRDNSMIQLAKPGRNIADRRVWLELASGLDAVQIVFAPQNLRRLVRAGERAGDEKIDAWDDLVEATRRALHLADTLGRERTQRVVTAGGREDLSVFSDRVSNDEKFHELAFTASSRRAP